MSVLSAKRWRILLGTIVILTSELNSNASSLPSGYLKLHNDNRSKGLLRSTTKDAPSDVGRYLEDQEAEDEDVEEDDQAVENDEGNAGYYQDDAAADDIAADDVAADDVAADGYYNNDESTEATDDDMMKDLKEKAEDFYEKAKDELDYAFSHDPRSWTALQWGLAGSIFTILFCCFTSLFRCMRNACCGHKDYDDDDDESRDPISHYRGMYD